MDLKSNCSYPHKKKGHTETKKRVPCENRGRDWSDVAKSHGIPRTVSHHLKEALNKCICRAVKRNQPITF